MLFQEINFYFIFLLIIAQVQAKRIRGLAFRRRRPLCVGRPKPQVNFVIGTFIINATTDYQGP